MKSYLVLLRALVALLEPAFLFFDSNAAGAAEFTITGVIRAEEEVTVRSQFPGIVQRIAVREGDRVREGQLLVQMKSDRQKIALDLARAGLSKAEASVEETKVLLANAEKEVSRVKVAAQALPRKELEDRTDHVLRLQASLNAQLADSVQASEEVKLRENELKETQLLAPFDGTVTQIYINRGDTLRPLDTQVLELVALENLYAELLLPSSYVQKIQLEQKIKVQVESEWMGRFGQIYGTVMYATPKVDASSRTFKVKVRIPNANGLVRPGMLVQVRFDLP
jgi:membrane fusion protein (multidrug efflux system)